MPALNFKTAFAPMVEAGIKTQTIRKPRKRPWRRGDRVHLYTGLRTQECRKLGEGEVLEVRRLLIAADGRARFQQKGQLFPRYMSAQELHEFAQADGFDTTEEFVEFFRSHYGLPFTGDVIYWGPVGTVQQELELELELE